MTARAAVLLLAAGCLAMAVAETSLWMHYLIDAGESISLAGVAFMLVAGIYLYRRGRLLVSLPLAIPWLLFPVITQGDQIIDNLSIDWMRFETGLHGIMQRQLERLRERCAGKSELQVSSCRQPGVVSHDQECKRLEHARRMQRTDRGMAGSASLRGSDGDCPVSS